MADLKDVERAVDNVIAGAREAGDSAQQVAGNFQEAVDVSVRDNPMATLLVAGLVDFVLGAIWKA